jgi:hypothetical protein
MTARAGTCWMLAADSAVAKGPRSQGLEVTSSSRAPPGDMASVDMQSNRVAKPCGQDGWAASVLRGLPASHKCNDAGWHTPPAAAAAGSCLQGSARGPMCVLCGRQQTVATTIVATLNIPPVRATLNMPPVRASMTCCFVHSTAHHGTCPSPQASQRAMQCSGSFAV